MHLLTAVYLGGMKKERRNYGNARLSLSNDADSFAAALLSF